MKQTIYVIHSANQTVDAFEGVSKMKEGDFAVTSQAEFLDYAGRQTMKQLVTLYNNLPIDGTEAVARFKSRDAGAARIWNLMQQLVPVAAAAPAEASDGKQSKKALVMSMMRRKGGASNDDIQQATGWQAHTVRGFIATLRTKHRIEIEAVKEDSGLYYRMAQG